MEKLTLDIRHLMVLALGSSEKSQPTIKQIYRNNELYFYEKYKKSLLSNDELKEIYPAIDLEHINMLIGIIEDAYDNMNFANIDEIIKAFNPRIFKFIKNKSIIDVDEFLDKEIFHSKHIKKQGTGLFFDEKFDETYIFNTAAILTYVAVRNGLGIKGVFVERVYRYYQNLANSLYQQYRVEKIPEDLIPKIELLKKEYNLEDDFVNRQETVGNLFNNLIEYSIEKKMIDHYGYDLFKKRGMTTEEYDRERTKIFKVGMYRYLGIINMFLPIFGIEGNIFFSKIPVNSDIVNRVLFSCLSAMTCNNVPKENLDQLIISELLIYGLAHQYKELKQSYLFSEKEKYFDDLSLLKQETEKKHNELIQKEEELNLILSKSTSELQEIKEKNTEKDNTIRNLKKQIEKIEKENEKLKGSLLKQKEENDILKKVIESNEKDIIEISLDEKLETLNTKKIAIIGGNTNAFKQLKGYLMNVTAYYNSTDDLSGLENYDAIFINHQWISHSLFNKVWSLRNKINVPIRFISGTNAKQIIDKIYIELKENV